MKMKEKWKNLSTFQKVAIILTIILVIAIIIQIGVLVDYKEKIDQRRKENEQIEKILPSEEAENSVYNIFIQKWWDFRLFHKHYQTFTQQNVGKKN